MAPYRPPVPTLKRPKKPTIPALSNAPAPGKGVVRPPTTPPAPAAPAAPAPTAPAAPPAPAPAPRSGPAPQTTAGANARTTAGTTYQAALRSGRQSIVDAALKLGSPEIIAALKADPNFAEYVAVLDKGAADPGSSFAQSQVSQARGLEGIDNDANRGNTFFSGLRLKDRGKLNEDFNTARSGYLQDYTTGFNTLVGGMGQAKNQYEADLRGADETDQAAWLAQQPAATGPDTGAPAPAPAASPNLRGVTIGGKPVTQAQYNSGALLQALLAGSKQQQAQKKKK